MPTVDLADVQGFILRGYRVAVARHFMLQIVQPSAAKQFLARLVSGDPDLPQITTAAPWRNKPQIFLNLGLTYEGLQALNVAASDLGKFPTSFRLGATNATITARVGDIGDSGPEHWLGKLGDPSATHLVLSLWAMSDEALAAASADLRAQFAPGLVEQSAHEGTALPHNLVHFGYRDSIAQPTIDGAPSRKRELPDDQPIAPTGEFLMGYPSQNLPAPGQPGTIYSVSPTPLSLNSSFAAFRILEQDAPAFEQFLQDAGEQTKLDPELIAAKVCGRWRNGVPLSLSAETATPSPEIPYEQFNNFTYVHADDPAQDDTFGYNCPIGSHIRRSNPRNQAVVGGPDSGHLHRIVRRAMPYGPAYDPQQPDTQARGLIGWFINVSLQNQFEFIMNSWINTATFVTSVKGPNGTNPVKNISGQDVMMGGNTADGSPPATSFTLPIADGNQKITGFPRFITTRGGVYCYLPSITAINYLAQLPDE